MLCLRRYLLSVARVASPLAAASSLHRLLPYSTTTTSPVPFVAEEFLIASCGLTPSKALEASSYLAHLKSPSKPEAVLAFLKDIGLTKADVAAVIAMDPRILCSKVDKTLRPRIGKLHDIGLSLPQISSLITAVPRMLRTPDMIPRLEFYLSFVGSYEKVDAAIRRRNYILRKDVERVVKPNIAFLRQCGLTDYDIAEMFSLAPGMIQSKSERLKEIVVCADKFGVPHDSLMFKHVLASVFKISPARVSSRSDFLMKALGCSEAEVSIAVRKSPYILSFTEDRMTRLVDFLMMKVGLEPNYIVRRPVLLNFSLTRRLVPRHFVLEALKAKGLVKKDIEFWNVAKLSEKTFIKKFLDPYKESVSGLADAYAAACAGQVPPSVLP